MVDRSFRPQDDGEASPESGPAQAAGSGGDPCHVSAKVRDTAPAHGELLAEVERIAGLGGFVWTPGAEAPTWSDEFYRILGYEPGSVKPGFESYSAVVHPDDLERVAAAWSLAQSGTVPDLDYRIINQSTSEVRFVRAAARVYKEDGKVVRLVGALQDVTDAKRSAIAMEEALASARAAERVAGMGSFVVRFDPIEVAWSKGLEALIGLDEPGPDWSRYIERVHPDDRDKQRRWWQRLAHDRSPESLSVRVLEPDGGIRHLYTQAAAVRLADGVERVVGTTIDVSERVKLEEQLRHAAKMEAIGTLAAGVAHDFNNYLMVMDSSLSMLADSTETEREELVEAGRLALSRCMELTRQLLAFARRHPFRPQAVDLRDVVLGFQELLHRAVGRRAALCLDLGHGPLRARVDPRHVERMLTNLVVNAADAIEETAVSSGRITVRLETVAVGAVRRAVPSDVPAGRYACVLVEDNGGGIEPVRLPRIFDPYFTTKPHGRGTGLGLASVYGMARQNEGQVTVGELDGGTRFTLWFPQIEAEPSAAAEASPARTCEAPCTDGYVLIVEDVDQVRDIAARILRTAGFRTLTARHGAEALALLDAGHDVRLVLTDLQMPIMGGRQLAERLRARPGAPPVIFMTGYSEDTLGEGAEATMTLLSKPFTAERLVEFVRSGFALAKSLTAAAAERAG